MTEEVINAIVVASILLIAIGVGLWGIKTKNIARQSLGGALLLLCLFILLNKFPEYAIAFNTWAMLLVAIGAFVAVFVSIWLYDRRIKEENRIRQEEREHDFERRCLNDILDWAQKGVALLVELSPSENGYNGRQNLIHLAPLRAMNKWVMDASRKFAGDDKKRLLKKVDEAAENLEQYCEMLEGTRQRSGVVQKHEQCRKDFSEVLERIADLKVKLQL